MLDYIRLVYISLLQDVSGRSDLHRAAALDEVVGVVKEAKALGLRHQFREDLDRAVLPLPLGRSSHSC